MKVKLKKTYFNPLYFILNEIIKDTTIRTVLVYGGKSSSKTISICQVLAKEALIKHASTISYRKESAIIPTTLKKSYDLALRSMFITTAFDCLDRQYRCQTGSEIVMKGLDKEEKAKGIESFKYVYLDELNHFTHAEYSQFNLSLRGIEGQKIFASWNPVDENSWVKTDLVDKYIFQDTGYKLPSEHSFVKKSICGKVILIKTTYEDNFWVYGSPDKSYGFRDENLIAEYENLSSSNYNSYMVNVLGEWGKTTFGGEILKCWKSETHTGNYPYNPKLAVHLIFDENTSPYFPCSFFQVGENQKDIFMIAVLAMKHPDNTVTAICKEISRKLREWNHTENVYIGGDPTSKKDDVKQEKGHDLFRLIMGELAEWKPQRRVLQGSPSVKMSTDFFNSILQSEIQGLKFRVDKSCRVAILDFENTKEDKNGKVDKKTVVNPVTKVSYQPYGHIFDISRYFLVYTFAAEYAIYNRGGVTSSAVSGKNVSRNTY